MKKWKCTVTIMTLALALPIPMIAQGQTPTIPPSQGGAIQAINQEIADRTAADDALQGNISAEASTRSAEDVNLKSQIVTVQIGLDDEIDARTVGDAGLQQQIGEHQTRIDDLTARVGLLESGGGPGPEPRANIIVVALDGSGDYMDPLAAVNSIMDASEDNPYVVKIMHGVYDIGHQSLQMKPFVDVEGAGEGDTTLRGTGQGWDLGSLWDQGLVRGASNAEIRMLTLEEVGGDPIGSENILQVRNSSFTVTDVTINAFNVDRKVMGILCVDSTLTLKNVTIQVSSTLTGSTGGAGGIRNAGCTTSMNNVLAIGTSFGVVNGTNGAASGGGSNVTMTNVTATATNGGAIRNGSSVVTMTDVTAIAMGDGVAVDGVYNENCPSVSMNNVTVTASGAGEAGVSGVRNRSVNGPANAVSMTKVTITVTGGASNSGVYNWGFGNVIDMTDVSITSNGGNTASGVYIDDSPSTLMTNAMVVAAGATSSYGVYGHGTSDVSATVSIRDSVISGSSYSLLSNYKSLFVVENTQLNGEAIYPGNLVCTGATDFYGNPLDAGCQP